MVYDLAIKHLGANIMATVICKSGLRGWRAKLRTVYDSLEEFKAYAEVYDMPRRLGFRTAEAAWKANPLVEGSTEPRDYRRVIPRKRRDRTSCR